MNYALIVVCVVLFLLHFGVWLLSEVNKNESSAVSSSIYFLCLILIYIFA